MKPKKSRGSAKNLPAQEEVVNECGGVSCQSKNVDMIRCNICLKYMCEQCNDVPVTKLKNVMEKCKSVYFVCKVCNDKCVSGSIPATIEYEEVRDVASTEHVNIGEMMRSFQQTFENKMTEMEAKIETIVEKKMDEKMPTGEPNNYQGANVIAHPPSETVITQSYATAVGPQDLRRIMQEQRNEDIVEQREKDKRVKNFIVHGLEQVGEGDEIKNNDVQTITKLLEVVGVTGEIESCTRMGKNEKKALKVVMKSAAAKDDVMKNLVKLKGTEETFGKISVTNDHTVSEREQIRKFVKDAEEKSKNDAKNIWRVRGDPKNGLRLVAFPRAKTTSAVNQ